MKLTWKGGNVELITYSVSRAFVDDVFKRFRRHFGKHRKDGARPMKGADWGGIMVLRALQRDVFG